MARIVGQVTVATAGVKVQGPSVEFPRQPITIGAHPNNLGIVFVGNSDVSATTGFALGAGSTVTLSLTNMDQVWFDASVNGQIVTYIGLY